MTTSLRYETAPAMWAIERPADSRAGAVLRVGARRVAVSDIRSILREVETERDVGGLVTMAGLFLFAAVVFVVGVVDIGWRTRFLFGAFVLGALAFVSLTESTSIRTVRYVRLRISTAEGDVVFTTPDAADADALEQRLAEERGRGHNT